MARRCYQSLLLYVRSHKLGDSGACLRASDRGRGYGKPCAVGVRFCYELLDNYIGQCCTTFFPHARRDAFAVLSEDVQFDYTKHYLGALRYLRKLKWCRYDDNGTYYVTGVSGVADVAESAFPHPTDGFGSMAANGREVFPDDEAAHTYLCACIRQDLCLRVGPCRVASFEYRMEAVYQLYKKLSTCTPEWIALWTTSRPTELPSRKWSPEQEQVLEAMRKGTSHADANVHVQRQLLVEGEPGSGKTEVLIHGTYELATLGCRVLVLCPTGSVVHVFRSRLPDHHSIVVETLHSALRIHREADKLVDYAPPSRLRYFDAIVIDEASQIDDAIFARVIMILQELPQKPFMAIGADWQQLSPIKAAACRMRAYCRCLPTITLRTIFRTEDPEHLRFLSTIRLKQPFKTEVIDYFRGRHWDCTLKNAVAIGMEKERTTGHPFSWLCVTNAGAAEVVRNALSIMGVTQEQLSRGMSGDPKVCKDPIYAAPGLVIRFTRNLDKDWRR